MPFSVIHAKQLVFCLRRQEFDVADYSYNRELARSRLIYKPKNLKRP